MVIKGGVFLFCSALHWGPTGRQRHSHLAGACSQYLPCLRQPLNFTLRVRLHRVNRIIKQKKPCCRTWMYREKWSKSAYVTFLRMYEKWQENIVIKHAEECWILEWKPVLQWFLCKCAHNNTSQICLIYLIFYLESYTVVVIAETVRNFPSSDASIGNTSDCIGNRILDVPNEKPTRLEYTMSRTT